MNFTRLAVLVLGLTPMLSLACGPSPQRVSKEIVIEASPKEVWALLGQFGGMHQWHSGVKSTTLEQKTEPDGKVVNYRTLGLKNGGTLVEKQRETQESDMKIGVTLEQGDMPVSNYSDAISVKPSPDAEKSIVTWVGRFSNKANQMQAPEGQDNVAAIAAITNWYETGLMSLKEQLEKKHVVLKH